MLSIRVFPYAYTEGAMRAGSDALAAESTVYGINLTIKRWNIYIIRTILLAEAAVAVTFAFVENHSEKL